MLGRHSIKWFNMDVFQYDPSGKKLPSKRARFTAMCYVTHNSSLLTSSFVLLDLFSITVIYYRYITVIVIIHPFFLLLVQGVGEA